MIRMIVAVLLAVNLVLLFWISGDKGDERDRRPLAGGDLKLLSELTQAAASQPVPVQPEETASQPGEVAQVQPAPQPENQTPPSQPAAVEESVGPATPAPQPAVAEQKPEAPIPPVNAQQPSPEVQALPQPAIAAPTPITPPPPPATSPVLAQPQEVPPAPKVPEPAPPKAAQDKPTCFSFGPLEERLAAIGVMARLKERTTDQSIRQEGSKHTEGFRVLIRTAKNEEEARALEQKILAAGITDIWRISRGEDQNAISMGMYSQQSNAAKRAEQAKGLGFDANIEAKVIDKTRFWINFSSGEPKLTTADLGLKPGPGQTLKKRACNGKASK
ncbi:MAG: SPOR domain-containing protein [Gammaproteobacteria bacterium]|nr:SPOR domain-containing protein [Gammaproteobacteria bacterium]MBU1655417.1 SPOR domain-containing protein [Gammaproteobacteria bacterium]MBU1962162.1 SPOR domain-containing protein [Gammaproteobacteria bacterium]